MRFRLLYQQRIPPLLPEPFHDQADIRANKRTGAFPLGLNHPLAPNPIPETIVVRHNGSSKGLAKPLSWHLVPTPSPLPPHPPPPPHLPLQLSPFSLPTSVSVEACLTTRRPLKSCTPPPLACPNRPPAVRLAARPTPPCLRLSRKPRHLPHWHGVAPLIVPHSATTPSLA